MPHQLRSDTFKNIGSLNKEIKGLQFDKTIDFYQHQDPNPIPITNMSREQWGCGILALNGKIYGVPSSGNITSDILEFRRTFPQLMSDWILYPQFNKL